MSKRKEIKEKEQLQAQFRLSLSKVDSRIESWLHETKDASKDKVQADRAAKDRKLFESLPIIGPGKGLSIADSAGTEKNGSGSEDESMRIGDFVKGGGKRNKAIQNRIRGIKRRREDSPSMRALRNKLRDTKREQIKRGMSERDGKSRKYGIRQETGKKIGDGSVSSSESEEEKDDMAYNAKKVNRGKRPF